MSSVMEGVDRLTRIAGQNRVELLLFQLGPAQTFGINVFKVREVLKCPQLRRVPQSNPHVCGVMHSRGQTVTVIDLASVLGMPPLAGQHDEFVVITEYNGRVQAYLVAKVERIVNLRWDEIHPPPRGIGGGNYLTAVVTIDNRLIEILDVERILVEIVGVNDVVSANLCEERGSTTRPRHVFVADDSMVARKQVTKVLDQIGFTYDVAENGRLAWAALKAAAAEQPILSRYSMAISDIEMPGNRRLHPDQADQVRPETQTVICVLAHLAVRQFQPVDGGQRGRRPSGAEVRRRRSGEGGTRGDEYAGANSFAHSIPERE